MKNLIVLSSLLVVFASQMSFASDKNCPLQKRGDRRAVSEFAVQKRVASSLNRTASPSPSEEKRKTTQ